MNWLRCICWWFGCKPIFGSEHHGDGVMPCERCGASDTTYEDRVGDTRHTRLKARCTYWLWLRWQPHWFTKCPACGQRGTCKPDCDGIPF